MAGHADEPGSMPPAPVEGEDFVLRESDPELTRTDPTLDGPEREHAMLLSIGSPENAFASAGQAIPLDGIGRVRFGRVPAERGLEVEARDQLLHVGLALPWVSSAHAELSVLHADDGFCFHLTDLGSRNGTQLEGSPVARARLRPGQVFELGRSFWMVRVLSSREHAAYGVPTPTMGRTASPRLKRLHVDLARLATGTASVLLVGETGTGKDHLARALHEASQRPGRFAATNVAARPLAGGEHPSAADLLLHTRAGTVLIGEVGELSAQAQLRLLELAQRAGPPANGEPGPRVDVRLVAASTRDLRAMATAGRFRPDLYACLAGYEARLPALRERREDLGLLVRAIFERDGLMLRVSTRAFRRLLAHAWPFNVRELANVLRAAAAVSDPDDTVTARGVAKVLARAAALPDDAHAIQSLRDKLAQCLIQHAGDVAAVASDLRCAPTQVESWLRMFELSASEYAALSDRSHGSRR